MSDVLHRSFAAIRAAQADGRTLVLAMVPFDQPAHVDDGSGPYREVFRRGAFEHVVKAPNRVELRYNHNGDMPPYGFGQELREDNDALMGVFRVAPSQLGDQMLALVADDQLRGVSIGYVPGRSRDITDDDGPLTERVSVKQLVEVSLTAAGAYKDAQVLAVRAAPDLLGVREREHLFWLRHKIGLMH